MDDNQNDAILKELQRIRQRLLIEFIVLGLVIIYGVIITAILLLK